MKAYQRVVRTVVRTGVVLGLCAGIYFGAAFLTNETIEDRERVTWCLDNGGRVVVIDNVSGCFRLTEVPIDTGLFGNPRGDCVANPAHVWTRFARGTERHCYSFARIEQEN